MIPNYHNREVNQGGVEDMASFGISLADSAHIMTILRDTLYSDKVLAVLREYSANAWDSHRMAGKPELPIKVVLPTLRNPTLTIEDFGVGLSHQDVFEVYTQYGASTKRTSELAVGMLGIGSKSGFAYSDSFTITSCHGGKRRIYVAVLDETEKGTINLLSEENISDKKTGVSIQIPVRPEDINEFTSKAQELFQHFNPRPNINTTLPPAPTDSRVLTNGIIYEAKEKYRGEWIAVMGCIPYVVDLSQLTGDSTGQGAIGRHANNLSGQLFFNIGEIQISASREALKYSTGTKKAIVAKFDSLVDEYVRTTLQAIENGGLTMWEKRIRAQTLSRLHLPVPKDCKDLTVSRVSLGKATTFKLGSGIDGENLIKVDRATQLVIVDDQRNLSGFQLSWDDEKLFPLDGRTPDEVEKEALELAQKAEIDGIPIIRISKLPWHPPPPKNPGRKKKTDVKHKVTTFVLETDRDKFCHPWSQAWKVEQRVPTPDDVYVVIEGFQVVDDDGFYRRHRRNCRLAKHFGVDVPPIYGYKTTKKKPRDSTNCIGVSYDGWEEKLMADILAMPDTLKKLTDYGWSVCVALYLWRSSKFDPMAIMRRELGKDHEVFKFFARRARGEKAVSRFKKNEDDLIKELYTRTYSGKPSEAAQVRTHLLQRYPLLGLSSNLQHLFDEEKQKYWLQYIKIVDQVLPAGQVLVDASELEEQEEDI